MLYKHLPCSSDPKSPSKRQGLNARSKESSECGRPSPTGERRALKFRSPLAESPHIQWTFRS